jgi:hypothetical protein
MFQLLIVSSRKSAQLSYLGGAGVEGGQGSNDYNYGEPPICSVQLFFRGQGEQQGQGRSHAKRREESL